MRNQTFSAIFKKSNVNFLLEVILFLCSLNKGLFEHIFEFMLLQMCACLKEHMREVID